MAKIICMIPARLDSQRFPKKILAPLGAHTLLGNVIEAAKKISLFDEVIVAVCSEAVAEIARRHGVTAVLTDPGCPNGTMRIIQAIEREGIDGDIFVNWQADEPFVDEEMIEILLADKEADVWTLKKKVSSEEALESSIVKVVTDKKGRAMYFSRARIPFEQSQTAEYFKHIGMYAFTKEALQEIKNLSATNLEACENLEQLRWLENGMKISVRAVTKDVIGIDTKADLTKANKITLKHV